MSKLDNIIKNVVRNLIAEQAAPTPRELDNAPTNSGNIPFTPAEKKFIGKFDAYGTTHLGLIYSLSDIGISEFIARSGVSLNLTPGILINLLRNKFIKIVPYTGYGSNDNYTIELQISLDSIKGWGAAEQDAAEKKAPSGAAPAGGAAPEPPMT
jgi:hypothetical protein